jgi:hypothetical protein
LQEHRFVHVRTDSNEKGSLIHHPQATGTPGSGKTTLAYLLSDYIKEKEPETRVIFITAWATDRQGQRACFHELVQYEGWNIADPQSVLIIDEAQDTYTDKKLWVGVFKTLAHEMFVRMKARVILFASYGSPSMRLLEFATTPITLPDFRRYISPMGI